MNKQCPRQTARPQYQKASLWGRFFLRRPHALTGRVAATEDAGPDIGALGTAAEGPFAAETDTGLRVPGVATASLAVAKAEESAASDEIESPIRTAPPPGMTEPVEVAAIAELEADSTELTAMAVAEDLMAVGTSAEVLADATVEVVA